MLVKFRDPLLLEEWVFVASGELHLLADGCESRMLNCCDRGV